MHSPPPPGRSQKTALKALNHPLLVVPDGGPLGIPEIVPLGTIDAKSPAAQESRVLRWFCMNDQKPSATKPWLKNRRSERIELSVPVVVYRSPGDGPQFCENTQTLVVSAHGALVGLTQLVVPRQKIRVQNPNSGEHLECRVVSVKKALVGPPRVAVEFTRPAPSFWRLAFPPDDWKANP